MAFDAGAAAFPTAFEPSVFFAGSTSGIGVVRRPNGSVLRRCRIETRGSEAAEFAALHFDEAYVFDDGSPEDRMRWAVTRRPDGGLDAEEESVRGRIVSHLRGPEWRVRFRRRATPPDRGPLLTYDARFSLVAPDLAMKVVTISLFGCPLALFSGFHRRTELLSA